MSTRSNRLTPAEAVQAAVAALAAGGLIVVVDDADREDEGDLIVAAELVTPGDVGELTDAIARLLDDPERRAALGANGRRRVDELFSWRAVAATVAEAYEKVIADHARDHRPHVEEKDQ